MSTTVRYPLFLTMAQELAVKLEKRSDVDSLALSLDMRAYEHTFLTWAQHRPENAGPTIARFISLVSAAQALLSRP